MGVRVPANLVAHGDTAKSCVFISIYQQHRRQLFSSRATIEHDKPDVGAYIIRIRLFGHALLQ